MKSSELKTELEKLGWRFGPQPHSRGVDWYAWRALAGSAADCTSNEKPPCLIINPWEITTSDRDVLRSVEFQVTGEVGDEWIALKVYSVTMDRAIEAIPRAEAILLAAWNAAATVPKTQITAEDAAKLESVTVGETFHHSHFADVVRAQKQTG